MTLYNYQKLFHFTASLKYSVMNYPGICCNKVIAHFSPCILLQRFTDFFFPYSYSVGNKKIKTPEVFLSNYRTPGITLSFQQQVNRFGLRESYWKHWSVPSTIMSLALVRLVKWVPWLECWDESLWAVQEQVRWWNCTICQRENWVYGLCNCKGWWGWEPLGED